MKIAVIGTGYVGLVAGVCFADTGHHVTCVDVDARKVDRLRSGEVPIYEPGLEEILQRSAKAGRLHFTTALAEAVAKAQVVFIAVGTPEGATGDADLQQVIDAARQIGRAMKQYTVVVDKSTVPVGTAEGVREAIADVTQVPFDVVSNPEFLKEGAAVDDFQRPDRVVIGTDSERARAVMAELYAPFVRTEHPILFMSTRSAELTKYAANAMLATRISFINDVAALCERLGADVDQVRKGLGADRRIGYPFLFPGVGYGGSCFPKDVKAMIAMGRNAGLELPMLEAVERTNARQKRLLLDKARLHFGDLRGRTFAVWGLSFKPKTDDLREAPSLALLDGMLEAGAEIRASDPVALEAARERYGRNVTFCADPYEAAQGADALFLVTEWNEYRHPDFERLKAALKRPVVFDGRNLFDPVKLREQGFVWYGVGRS